MFDPAGMPDYVRHYARVERLKTISRWGWRFAWLATGFAGGVIGALLVRVFQ